MGENTVGQLGTTELFPVFTPTKLNFMDEKNFIKVSAGFQHSLLLTASGEVYGSGKSDKFQLGEEYQKNFHMLKTAKDVGMGVQKLNLEIDDKIIDVSAGKYHSIFLTGKISFN